MKRSLVFFVAFLVILLVSVCKKAEEKPKPTPKMEEKKPKPPISPVDDVADPCLKCHETVTPEIVKGWAAHKHSKVGIKCYVCHEAKEGVAPSTLEQHKGFRVTAMVKPTLCDTCHPDRSKVWKGGKFHATK